MSNQESFESDSEQIPGTHSTASELVVPWRRIALMSIGATVAIAGGTTLALVLVATAENANALSTIALALATIAFVLQILVFVVGLLSNNQQISRSEDVYARLNGVLEGLRGSAQGTNEMLQNYFGLMLQAATGVAGEAAKESGPNGKIDPEELEKRLTLRMQALVAEQATAAATSTPAVRRPTPPRLGTRRTPTPGNQRVIDYLTSFPDDDEEGKKAVETLKKLSNYERSILKLLAEDEIGSRGRGMWIGVKISKESAEGTLTDLELIRRAREPEGDIVYRLTEKGRSAARILTGTGDIPEWVPSDLVEGDA